VSLRILHRLSLASAGRQLIAGRYSWAQVAQQFETICEHVVQHQRKSAYPPPWDAVIPSRPFWSPYILHDYTFSDFSASARVLDAGCCTQLKQAAERGCWVAGVELDGDALADCRRGELTVVQAKAETLPFRTGSFDGLICKVVLPYTDEMRVLGEFARVLKPGGTACVKCHGLSYYVRYVLLGPGWKLRFYGLRTIVNSWLYAAIGRRVPGFLGDTISQSRPRLSRAYRRLGLRVIEDTRAPAFLGLPVFIYQRLHRADLPSLTSALK
jgi:SAM-dependent methyltransferase